MLKPPSSQALPSPRQIKKTKHVNGQTLTDPYAWLRDRENPEVIRYLQEENKLVEQVMRPTKSLQNKLFSEFEARIPKIDRSVPERWGNYYYFREIFKDNQYPRYLRSKHHDGRDSELLLDCNYLAKEVPYFSLGFFEPTQNHSILAYAVDSTGSEEYDIHFLNLNDRKKKFETIKEVFPGCAWNKDGTVLFYLKFDDTHRPNRVMAHKLGTDPSLDTEIYRDDDGGFFVYVEKSASGECVFVSSHSKTTSEVYWFDSAKNIPDKLHLIEKRREGHEYDVEHTGAGFLIRSNWKASNFQLFYAPKDAQSLSSWRSVLKEKPNACLEEIRCFERAWVAVHRTNASRTLSVKNDPKGNWQQVNIPFKIYALSLGNNYEFRSNSLRIHIESLATPTETYDVKMMTDLSLKFLRRKEVGGTFNPKDYEILKEFARADDGTKIPISIVFSKKVKEAFPRPTLLYGYGSYGISVDPSFSISRLSLLDRGFVFAIAHVRGGGENGRHWYEQGKKLNKKNTFSDFIRAAEHLISNGYTEPSLLAIQGGSAGGLLVGNVINQAPQIFKAAIAQVPFVDNLNTMLDPSLPLTVTEYDEWGNPERPHYFRYIKSYSPYENIKKQPYPNLLVTAGLFDPRVAYWEPAKWVAKIRTMNASNNLVLLKTNLEAGHGGASGRYDFLKEIALNYAFLIGTVAPEKK